MSSLPPPVGLMRRPWWLLVVVFLTCGFAIPVVAGFLYLRLRTPRYLYALVFWVLVLAAMGLSFAADDGGNNPIGSLLMTIAWLGGSVYAFVEVAAAPIGQVPAQVFVLPPPSFGPRPFSPPQYDPTGATAQANSFYAGGVPAPPPAPEPARPAPQVVDLNQASVAELAAVVGPDAAGRIDQARRMQRFTAVTQVLERGIIQAHEFQGVRAWLTVTPPDTPDDADPRRRVDF